MANGKQRMLQGVIARRSQKTHGHAVDTAMNLATTVAGGVIAGVGGLLASPLLAASGGLIAGSSAVQLGESISDFSKSEKRGRALNRISKAQQMRKKTGVYRKASNKIKAAKSNSAGATGTVKTHARRTASGKTATVKQHTRKPR